jgi:hypothetical protein
MVAELLLVLALQADPTLAEYVFIARHNEFIAKLINPDSKDTPLVKLQKARARSRALFVCKVEELMLNSSWPVLHIKECAAEHLVLWENLEELAQTPADKLKCAEMRIEAAKEYEKFIATRVEVGSDPSMNSNFATAARIDAEINLLKLKESLKDKK